MQELFANNAISTLASAITSTATSIALASGAGSLFPNPTPGSQFFRISLTDAATRTNHEICYCTARSGDTLTVTRNAEQVPGLAFPSSIGSAWSTGDIAANEVTAGMMINLYSPSADQANNVRYGVDTGTVNAYAVAFNPAIPTGTQATELIFKAANTNTGASTLTCNGGTSYAIFSPNGSALIGGEIQANQLIKVVFNANTSTYFIEWSNNSATLAFNTLTVNDPTIAAQVANKRYVDGSTVITAAGHAIKFSSGLILQMGQTADYTSEGGQIITLPIPFSSIISAFATIKLTSPSTTADQLAQVYGYTAGSGATTIGVYLQLTGGSYSELPTSATWLAIGY